MSFLPEDKKNRLGYWIFSWPWRTPFDEAGEVHDRNTSKDSYAAKIGIPGARVDENFSEMVDELSKAKKLSWGWRRFGDGLKGLVTVFSRWFVEGSYFKKD